MSTHREQTKVMWEKWIYGWMSGMVLRADSSPTTRQDSTYYRTLQKYTHNYPVCRNLRVTADQFHYYAVYLKSWHWSHRRRGHALSLSVFEDTSQSQTSATYTLWTSMRSVKVFTYPPCVEVNKYFLWITACSTKSCWTTAAPPLVSASMHTWIYPPAALVWALWLTTEVTKT